MHILPRTVILWVTMNQSNCAKSLHCLAFVLTALLLLHLIYFRINEPLSISDVDLRKQQSKQYKRYKHWIVSMKNHNIEVNIVMNIFLTNQNNIHTFQFPYIAPREATFKQKVHEITAFLLTRAGFCGRFSSWQNQFLFINEVHN